MIYKLDIWWCGDDYCNCQRVDVFKDGKRVHEGEWFWPENWFSNNLGPKAKIEDMSEIRLDLDEFCDKEGIPHFDLVSDDYWDWDEQEIIV